MWHEKTADAARGKWRGILVKLGVPDSYLTGKPGPCPLCGGKDRFRFDDLEGRGTWICNQCKAGDGMALAMRFHGLGFHDTAKKIDEIILNVRAEVRQPKPEMTDIERRNRTNAMWAKTAAAEDGDLLHRYFASRGLSVDVPDELRFAASITDGEGGIRPAMVAMVRDAEGKPATLHRTFLRPNGSGKAEMKAPRKLMPGPVSKGSAIQLSPLRDVLGIAEGIETATAASMLFGIPVWSAIDAARMSSWSPPEGVSEVHIFGDCDQNFVGQTAANGLAQRLSGKIDVVVRIPDAIGDWNDVLLGKVAP